MPRQLHWLDPEMGLLCRAQEQITELISCITGILTDTWAASVSIVYIYSSHDTQK